MLKVIPTTFSSIHLMLQVHIENLNVANFQSVLHL